MFHHIIVRMQNLPNFVSTILAWISSKSRSSMIVSVNSIVRSVLRKVTPVTSNSIYMTQNPVVSVLLATAFCLSPKNKAKREKRRRR